MENIITLQLDNYSFSHQVTQSNNNFELPEVKQ